MKSTDLRRLAAEELDAANAIIAAAADGMTDEQLAQVEKHQAEHDRLQHQADVLDGIESRKASLSEPIEANPVRSHVTTKLRAEDDPNRGFKNPSEFLTAIINEQTLNKRDDRLRSLTAGGDDHHTQDDTVGGYLLPPGFIADLLRVPAPMDPIGNRTRRIPIGPNTNSVELPARTDKNHSTSVAGGLTVAWTSETQAISTSQIALENVKLELHDLAGAAYVSEKLLRLSPISFAALLSTSFNDAFTDKRVDSILNGTGVGQPEGIANTPSLISVSKETGQAADTILYQNIVKMYARCWGRMNAVWLYNPDCEPQLMQMTDPAGNLIWGFSARDGEPNRLLGIPAIPTDYCETVGDLGDIYLANFNEYLEAGRGDATMESSIHVRFLNNERTFRFIKEMDGRCWWRSALTPKNGSNTRSPFVTLAARA